MNSFPSVDLDLLKKYDVPAPRYTSYPTALQFDESFRADELPGRMAEESSQRDLSLYFHIPFCEKLCWYCACNRIIEQDREEGTDYLDEMFREVDRRRPLLEGRQVAQIHLGGGTPTFLKPDDLRRLGGRLDDQFDIAQEAEISIEIDPRACSEETVAALADAGFNRASLGVQDHNPTVQEAIHRVQPFEQTARVVGWLRQAGFGSINFDLIYGLPHQTLASFDQTIADVLTLSPDRLAVYSYAHVPWVNPAQKLLEGEALPEADQKLRLFRRCIEELTDAGLSYIGLDHFAKPDDELARARREGTLRRNFQGYSTRGGTDVHAFGLSAISQTETMYFQNAKELDDYRQRLEAGDLPIFRGCTLSRDDRIRRDTIERVMCRGELDFGALSEELDIDFTDYFADELDRLAPLQEDGLLEVGDDHLRIAPLGRLFLRNIATAFDAYLDRSKQRYSKTV